MRRAIYLKSAWSWVAWWFALDITFSLLDANYLHWMPERTMVDRVSDTAKIAWFILGLTLLASHRVKPSTDDL